MSSPASFEPAPLAVTPAPAGQRILAVTLAVIGILAVLLGLLFIFAATAAGITNSPGQSVLGFLGHPFSALLVATLIAMF